MTRTTKTTFKLPVEYANVRINQIQSLLLIPNLCEDSKEGLRSELVSLLKAKQASK